MSWCIASNLVYVFIPMKFFAINYSNFSPLVLTFEEDQIGPHE